MNSARRSRRRQDWPRGLYEPRPGYYVWRHPDGRTFALGSIPLANARHQALQANAHLQATAPSLMDRLTGASETVAELLAKMPAAETPNTAKAWRSLDKKIAGALGSRACVSVTVKDVAELLEAELEQGKARSAQALRSRLVSLFARGMALGWIDANPASVTESKKVVVQRGRLTLDAFKAIYAKAPEVAAWLPQAMRLAIVTGADRSTIASLERSNVADGCLTYQRSKTGAAIAVPLRLRLDAMGLALADVVAIKSGVVSRYLVHHVSPWGNAPAGSKVHPDRISHAFTEARKLAGIADDGAPTFHEIRSLCKRLYEQQGGVDTRALLGHATERMSDLYADPRGVEAVRVRVG